MSAKWIRAKVDLAVDIGIQPLRRETSGYRLEDPGDGMLFVHRSINEAFEKNHPWRVSHVPTGNGVMGGFHRMKDARSAAEELVPHLLKDPAGWQSGKFGSSDGFGAGCKRLSSVVRDLKKKHGSFYSK